MEELESGIVFRLATVKASFPPDSAKLHVLHLELSERDKSSSKPMLSVFDGTRTSVQQAIDIRAVPAEAVAFGLAVEKVIAVRVPGLDRRLRVWGDPLDPPTSEMPGADGHCGIEGLDRRSSESKALYRELRVRLADLSFPYRDGMA